MKPAIHPAFLALSFALATPHALPAQADHAASIMAGISNRGRNPTQPYVTAGDRAYLIGTQDGNFPDMGDHVPGEMAGLWVHPIKLIDGFRAEVVDLATNRDTALSNSTEFVTYPYGTRLRYGRVLDSLDVERFQFSPDGRPGVVVQYIFRNADRSRAAAAPSIAVKTDLRPVWFSEHLGITDARTRSHGSARERCLRRPRHRPPLVLRLGRRRSRRRTGGPPTRPRSTRAAWASRPPRATVALGRSRGAAPR